MYWYHPHVRQDLQQELGLYGNLLVRSDADQGYGPANREAVLMLDDLLIGDPGTDPAGRRLAHARAHGTVRHSLLVNGEGID